MAFVLALALFGVVLWFLYRQKQDDLARCREILGLDPAPSGRTSGTTAEGFAYAQSVVAAGQVHGRPATLFERTVRSPHAPKTTRHRGGQFTVFEVGLPSSVRVPLRLQPAGVLGALERFSRGAADDRVPIAPDFDAAYVTYSSDPDGARAVLTPALREQVLAFRTAVAGPLSASIAGKMASGLVLGTFQVDGTTASYAIAGSPTKAIAEHVSTAVPVLLGIAAAASA